MTGFTLAAATLLATLSASAPAQPPAGAGSLSVTDDGWQVSGDVKVDRHLGRDALPLGTGTAYHPARRFRDGTIEFDLATAPFRTFVAVRFRARSANVWEEIYHRPVFARIQ